MRIWFLQGRGCVCLTCPVPQSLGQCLARSNPWMCICRKKEQKGESGEVRKGFLEEIRKTNFDPATGGFWALKMTSLACGEGLLPPRTGF